MAFSLLNRDQSLLMRAPHFSSQGPSIGADSFSLGQTGGIESYTLMMKELPPHSHRIVSANAKAITSKPVGNALANEMIYGEPIEEVVLMQTPLGVAGGSAPFSIMQPYMALTYMICVNPNGCDGMLGDCYCYC